MNSNFERNNELGGSIKKPRGIWDYVYAISQIIQLLIVVVILAVTFVPALREGPGTTFALGLIVIPILVLVLAMIALSNLVTLPLYMIKKRPGSIASVAGILSLLLSIVILLGVGYFIYQFQSARTPGTVTEISVEQAKEMLIKCDIDAFYTRSAFKDMRPEDSSTGVLLYTSNGKDTLLLNIAKRHMPELLPIAQDAQKTCGYFTID